MSIENVLARARAAAEGLMTDTCQIQRRISETTGAGGVVTPVFSTLYSGQKCRVQVRSETGAPATVGEAYRIVERSEIHLPMSVVGLAADDVITITASGDADLVGKVFAVRDVLAKSHASARRVGVTLVTS